ncbi:hypothetical protein [Polyangium aurulentum]|uniref:hypothetical protein n=1 Tax=Polyangium aurulentum TaxID=2567896 RepID=UPI0010ADBF70|nr:hypothetical protein [Polyangium aurulentum]UQA58024.1 DUF3568 domain-containing protein [Polyangium aurulentum]
MSRIVRLGLVLLALSGPALVTLSAEVAEAATAYESPYSFDQTWSSSLRLVRVDLGLKITEKDPDHGYLLFEYTSPESGKRVHAGSLEVVRAGRDVVRVAVQLPTLPSYHERMIVDALAKKLLTEYGDPPRRPDPPPPPENDATPPDDAEKH